MFLLEFQCHGVNKKSIWFCWRISLKQHSEAWSYTDTKKAWVWRSWTFTFSVTCHDCQGPLCMSCLSLSFTVTVGGRGYFMVSRRMGCFSFSFFPDHPLCCCCTNTGQFWVFLLFHIHIDVYMCNYFVIDRSVINKDMHIPCHVPLNHTGNGGAFDLFWTILLHFRLY